MFTRLSTAPIALLAYLTVNAAIPVRAQTRAAPTQLDPIIVTSPQRKPVKRASAVAKPEVSSHRVAQRSSGPVTPAPALAPAPADAAQSPLNTSGVATTNASRLGLTVREIPATVEEIDQSKIREQGYRTTTEVAQGAVGVTAGDGPGEPAAFSMRGFSNSQINVLYNGIKIGPQNMTSQYMDTANLERVEILKGPASLLSGEGASGGAINYVNKQPTSGPIQNEAFFSWDSLNSFRSSYGSGGSTSVQGLDYRFDISQSSLNGFIDDTDTKTFNVSGQLNYRVSENLKVWGAIEYKQDFNHAYWGTPLVSAASSGPYATRGIVHGTYISNDNGTNLGPVTIDSRTLSTNYNVADNYVNAQELWLRGGFELALADNLTLKSQIYGYGARREWKNSEVSAFNSALDLVDREGFYVAHDQKLFGNMTDLTWDTRIAGMENRLVTTVAVSNLDFGRPGAANFPHDDVPLVGFDPGLYGLLTTQVQTAVINNQSLSFEDRLRITPAFALVAGVRVEGIELSRNSTDVTGANKPGFPFAKDWTPGRPGNHQGRRDRRGGQADHGVEVLGQFRLCRRALCRLRIHRRGVLGQYAAQRAVGRRQRRRLLSLRYQIAGRTRTIGALCRQPLQLRRQHSDHGCLHGGRRLCIRRHSQIFFPGRRPDPRHLPGAQPVRPPLRDLGRSVLSGSDPARRATDYELAAAFKW